ncbi:MAG TPA: hypothetical protein VLS49_01305 [Usitatibacter sp.]|nr:hypothetical protein [Usitatibacter sp.]
MKSATTEEGVVALVRDYLGEWDREEIASLPPSTWPAEIRDRADIMSWMFRIGEIHSRFRGPAAALMRLQELLLFFTHAAVRVTQIGAGGDPAPANEAGPRSSECGRPTASWRERSHLRRRGER